MRTTAVLLFLGVLLVPAPAAHAMAPAAAHLTVQSTAHHTPDVTVRPGTEVRAAASGGRSRGGYRGTGGHYSGSGGSSSWSLWLGVGILCAIAVWFVVAARRRKQRGDDSD